MTFISYAIFIKAKLFWNAHSFHGFSTKIYFKNILFLYIRKYHDRRSELLGQHNAEALCELHHDVQCSERRQRDRSRMAQRWQQPLWHR